MTSSTSVPPTDSLRLDRVLSLGIVQSCILGRYDKATDTFIKAPTRIQTREQLDEYLSYLVKPS